MASTLTTFDMFMKERYTSDTIEWLTCKERPFLSMLRKETDGSGRRYIHPVGIGNPQGLGATLAKAQAAAQQAGTGGVSKGEDWIIDWGDYDGSVEIGDKVIKCSKDQTGSFLRNKATEIDRLYEAFGDTMGYYVFSGAGKALVSTGTISSGVITVTNVTDLANIELGQILVASANDGTSSAHSLLGSGSVGYVIAVDMEAKTFTVSTTANGSAGTPTGWTGTMYFFRDGDFGGTSTPNRIFDGLGSWIPSSAPSSTAFNGVDRTRHITWLSGVRLAAADYAGMGVEQRLKKLVTRMTGVAKGPGPSCVFLNPEKWQDLADSIESRGNRPLDGGTAKFNYSKIVLAMGGKMVDIYADRFCPLADAFAVKLDSIFIKSVEGFPHVLNGDGLEMLRKSTTNDYEYRIVAYPVMAVPEPGWHGRVPV